MIGPGLLVAATGVGAGDLATAAFAGSKLGTGVMWAVVLGAAIKLVLNENLARFQIASGLTVLEGMSLRLGRIVHAGFGVYLFLWTWFVVSALASASGVTLAALLDADASDVLKSSLGTGCSIAGLALIWIGGFKLFERVMAVCIAGMFAITMLTALLLGPDVLAVIKGLLVPVIPAPRVEAETGSAAAWTLSLLGGVGGTLTIICYAYWMREHGRDRAEHLRMVRIDLAIAYALTALFGLAMVSIASGIDLTASGSSNIVVQLADRLGEALGPGGRVLFLIGAFAAVFSSLLGVWQAVPYVFADWLQLARPRRETEIEDRAVSERSAPYRWYLVGMACVAMLSQWVELRFSQVQLAYGIVGALFIPLLALALLVLNNPRGARRGSGGAELTNSKPMNAALAVSMVVVAGLAAWNIVGLLGG